MNSQDSFTQLFYDLLDMPKEEQQQMLDVIKDKNKVLYHKLVNGLDGSSDLNISELIGFHAEQSVAQQDEPNFSGHHVGKYKLLNELGRGGMGSVYEAIRADDTFEQKLAIKLIHPRLDGLISADFLYLEAQVLARLGHPNIAKVFDGGKHHDSIYIAMERVNGHSLSHLIKTRALTRTRALRLFTCIASAIAHAHQNQILHADIKPDNILIDELGNPKVIDFNIAQKVENSALPLDSGLLAYSKEFASPEQIQGEYLTNQSDVYSLGKLLDAMLINLDARSDEALLIKTATQSEPEKRYTSVDALIRDVDNILHRRPISLKLNQPLYVLRKFVRRNPFPVAASLVLLFSVVVFSVVLVNKNQQLNAEKIVAEEMIFELTQLMFHAKGNVNQNYSVQNMLELTRRRVLSNPKLSRQLKQQMLLAMMTPIPERTSEQKQQNTQTNNE